MPGLEAELEVARTAVQAALADRDEAADMVRIADRLEAGSAITERELTRRRNLLRTATARVSEARARLAHAEANLALYNEAVGGASIAIEKAAVEQSRAAVALFFVRSRRRTYGGSSGPARAGTRGAARG